MSATDDRSADQIERDLESTRAELGETLEVLGDRLDVKTRVTRWTQETYERARVQAKTLIDERPRELGIAGGALVLATATLLLRRGKRQ